MGKQIKSKNPLLLPIIIMVALALVLLTVAVYRATLPGGVDDVKVMFRDLIFDFGLLFLIISLALLCAWNLFARREIKLRRATAETIKNYFRSGFLNDSGLSFDTVNFLSANLLDNAFDKPATALSLLNDYYEITKDANYLRIAADLCNFVAKRHKKNRNKRLGYQLACVYYCRTAMRAAKNMSSLNIFFLQLMLIYNEACNGIFAYLREQSLLNSDSITFLDAEQRRYILRPREIRSSLPPEAFSDFIAASDYTVKFLRMQNRQFGLGVPLIGFVKNMQIYKSLRTPPGMTVPVTFLLQLRQVNSRNFDLLPVYQDTLKSEFLPGIKDYAVFPEYQLALDFSTPLGAFVNGLPTRNLISVMLYPKDLQDAMGLYMIEPFNPEKIPVIFVHGLMSSPTTWLQMVNSLKSNQVLRRRYQFWFFFYSSGMPVSFVSQILRRQILAAYEEFATADATRANFERAVIVGHSMGGMLTRTMVQKDPKYLIENILGTPWSELSAKWNAEEKAETEKLLLNPALPFVHRVVFMAVPHRGSDMAKSSIAKLGIALIKMPPEIVKAAKFIWDLFSKYNQVNAHFEYMSKHIVTGIDNLTVDNPFVKALGDSKMKDDLVYHSIIGNTESEDQPGGTDGIVPYWSSHLDGADSEWIVRSDHGAHRSPSAIRELQRILLLNLNTEPKGSESTTSNTDVTPPHSTN